jgi:hypothetical protein
LRLETRDILITVAIEFQRDCKIYVDKIMEMELKMIIKKMKIYVDEMMEMELKMTIKKMEVLFEKQKLNIGLRIYGIWI